MADHTPHPSRAGGFAIAAGIMLGCIGGLVVGQPSAGFLVGLAVGIVIAVVLWRR